MTELRFPRIDAAREAVNDLRAQLVEARLEVSAALLEASAAGVTWQTLGDYLGVTRQAVHDMAYKAYSHNPNELRTT